MFYPIDFNGEYFHDQDGVCMDYDEILREVNEVPVYVAEVTDLTAKLKLAVEQRNGLMNIITEHTEFQPGELIHKQKPSHGNCCTCQDCGYNHDDCWCEHNAIVEALAKIGEQR